MTDKPTKKYRDADEIPLSALKKARENAAAVWAQMDREIQMREGESPEARMRAQAEAMSR